MQKSIQISETHRKWKSPYFFRSGIKKQTDTYHQVTANERLGPTKITSRVRPIPVSGDTILTIAADTGLASVGHGAISRRDRYRADTVCGRASHATGSMRIRHIST
jgi:hypothetical protein